MQLAPLFLFFLRCFCCGDVDAAPVSRVCFEWWSRDAGPRARRLSFLTIFVDRAPTCNTSTTSGVTASRICKHAAWFTNRGPSRLRTVLHATRCSPRCAVDVPQVPGSNGVELSFCEASGRMTASGLQCDIQHSGDDLSVHKWVATQQNGQAPAFMR